MKNNQSFRILAAIILLWAVLLPSCKKFVDIPAPQTQAESSRVFSSDAAATSAVVGLYNQMIANNLTLMNGAVTIYTGLSADEMNNVNANSNYDAFMNNAIPANSTTVYSSFWSNAYRYIYQANAVLEGLDQSATISTAVKDELRGEMLFTRALTYFYLVNLFGDVPLVLSTDYRINGSLPRASATAVEQQLLTDLTEAAQLLAANAASGNARPGRTAATALLARVYLYQKDWVNAEKQATAVLSPGTYTLENDLNQVFTSSSSETIFQLVKPTANTAEGAAFIPGSATSIPTFKVTGSLLQAFEKGDNRRNSWLKTNTVGGTDYTYPYKYKVRNSTSVTENNIVLRLAEVYLIRAEARAQQDKIIDALADLNVIRHRAGLAPFTAGTRTATLQAVMHERQTELFAEWGHRWLDLKRTGQANEVLAPIKGANWQPADTLYPIPQSQIQLNPFLKQNPGY